LIKRFAEQIGTDPANYDQVAAAFLEMLGVAPGNEAAGISQPDFVQAFVAHTSEMELVFGAEPTHQEWQHKSAFGDEADDFKNATRHGRFDELARSSSPLAIVGMSETKIEALKGIFSAADDDDGGTIGPDELFRVLSDVQLGGVLAKQMRTSFGMFSDRFIRTMLEKLDRNGDGEFDFNEFCTAFGPVIDDEGQYQEEKSVTGAQLYALTQEFRFITADVSDLQERLEMAENDLEFKTTQHHIDMVERERLNEQSEEEAARLAAALSKAEAELSSRRRTMDSMEERLASALDEASEMKSKADTAIADKKRLVISNQHKDMEIHSLQRKLDEAEQRVAELEATASQAHQARSLHAQDTGAELSVLEGDLRVAQVCGWTHTQPASVNQLPSIARATASPTVWRHRPYSLTFHLHRGTSHSPGPDRRIAAV
jgi:Ca2+-binding EF-hand superfamily protein